MRLSEQQTQAYEPDGYVIVPSLFSRDEVELSEKIARADRQLKQAHIMQDAKGGESKIWLATEIKRDIYNALAHCPRVIGPTEQLLSGPVYLWHYKMMMKEPRVGGAWEWHQDYGYWYGDGCLYPQMLSCMIAVNRATRDNGCLQVLRGSHLLGRINHGGVGGQSGAESQRVEAAMKRLELVHVELEPGDALFFHCNTLHCSAQNHSEHPRWAFITCYNSMQNIPYRGGHGAPIKIDPWSDGDVLNIGREQLTHIEAALQNTK